MELRHAFTVPAPVDRTWEAFMDLEGVAGCFPGATVTRVDGDSFEGTCKVKLGPIALVYAGSGTFVERDNDGHRVVIQATGKDKRGNGTAGATVIAVLAAAADGGTSVDVTTDLTVTGKPAQFGRGVMQDVSDKLLGRFVACLEQRLTEPDTEDAASPTTSAEAPPDRAAAPPSVEPPDEDAPTPKGEAAPKPAATAAENADGVSSRALRPPRGPLAGPDDALDLGAAVLPVLVRTYGPYLLGAFVGTLVGVRIGRRRR